jgi:hypothetical protein
MPVKRTTTSTAAANEENEDVVVTSSAECSRSRAVCPGVAASLLLLRLLRYYCTCALTVCVRKERHRRPIEFRSRHYCTTEENHARASQRNEK